MSKLIEPGVIEKGERGLVCEPSGRREKNISASPRVALQNGLYIYRVTDKELAHGSSLGNAKAWAISKGTGAIEGIFSVDVGMEVLGSMVVGYFIPYNDLSHFGCPRSPLVAGEECDRLVMLSQVGGAQFTLHPAYQRRDYSAIGMVDVSETFFLPRTGMDDEAVAFFVSRLTNNGDCTANIAVIACQDFVGGTPLDICAEYSEQIGGLIAWNESRPEWMRAFCVIPTPSRHMATNDIEESYDPGAGLSNRTEETGRLVGSLQVDLALEPGETREVAVMTAFSPDGREGLRRIYDRYKDHERSFQTTLAEYEQVLHTSEVVTPDVVINQGGQWSKANMLRVLANYPVGGTGFTNDPGRSPNIVGRDVAWFVHGCDFVTPLASCSMLAALASFQKQNGMITEYYNGITGETDDYGLNINDNTPLFIMASAHHLTAAGHRACLENLYPAMVKAADYIISQEDGRGLVFCTARGTGVRGIVGWRNIIENKNISGAVTEINSECYAALRAVAEIAASIGREEDHNHFSREADKLREAINKHLLNPKNGTYYLNIDPDGNIHTEVTADEVFPLLCGVSDDDTSRLVSTRLSSPDFMTAGGLRTVPSQNPLYISDKRIGLEGGVWPGVTWWYAMASATTDPGVMVKALRSSYQHYIEDPGVHNTVPGQFSEWFDGQSLVNRGMRLSPWEPPRFLWALLEGAVGLDVGLKRLAVNPRIPPDWRWLILRNLPYQEESVSFFMARRVDGIYFFTTSDFDSDHHVERFETDLSDKVRPLSADMYSCMFRRGGEVVICLASTAAEKETAAFAVEGVFDPARQYKVSVYASETGDWAEIGPYSGDYLNRMSAWIEPGGFSLLSITEA